MQEVGRKGERREGKEEKSKQIWRWTIIGNTGRLTIICTIHVVPLSVDMTVFIVGVYYCSIQSYLLIVPYIETSWLEVM